MAIMMTITMGKWIEIPFGHGKSDGMWSALNSIVDVDMFGGSEGRLGMVPAGASAHVEGNGGSHGTAFDVRGSKERCIPRTRVMLVVFINNRRC